MLPGRPCGRLSTVTRANAAGEPPGAGLAEAVFAAPGGGGFLMARRAGSNKAALFDFFVETPLKRRSEGVAFFPIHADFGPAKQEFHIGLGSSATPGIVPGLFAMHEGLCSLPMKRLVEPAARAARAGFPLSAFQAYLFTVIAPILTASPGVEQIFAPRGRLMTAGETFRNEELGETLAWLAEDGARLFVDGDVGQAIMRSRCRAAAISPRAISNITAWRSAIRSTGATEAPRSHSIRRRRQAARSSPSALLILRRSPTAAARSIPTHCARPWRRSTKRARRMARILPNGSPAARSRKSCARRDAIPPPIAAPPM